MIDVKYTSIHLEEGEAEHEVTRLIGLLSALLLPRRLHLLTYIP